MRPTRLTFAASLLFLALTAAALFFPGLGQWLHLPPLVLAALAGVDALVLALRPAPALTRRMPAALTAGRPAAVELRFAPGFARGLLRPSVLRVFDGIPAEGEAEGLPARFRLDSRRRRRGFTVGYRLAMPARGRYDMAPAWVEVSSWLGFWWRRHRLGAAQEIRVYPDYRAVLGSLRIGGINADGGRLNNQRRRGLGLEFHQLREYRQGDMMRMVDPKASSRFGKLIVRDMQEEEDQTVIFLLDTGYRMCAAEGGKTHFDQAFEAMLSLAWVALKQGDRVGVRSWGPQERWLPPRRGLEAFTGLVQGLYDLQAQPEASSPATILAEMLPRLNRRALIIMLTNFREEDGEDLQRYIPIVQARHLLCTVWMREAGVEALAARLPDGHDQALETMMARQYLADRRRCRTLWEDAGLLTLDTEPAQLSARLVQQYWDIKTRGLL